MKFSIIMASFNQVDFIEQAINSVLHQTYQDFELIIVDGFSDDGSQNIIHKYDHLHNVKIIIEKDKGLYHARNKGILIAEGDIIGFLNTDDYYEKDALSIVSDFFLKHPSADVIYGINRAVDRDGNFLRMDGDFEFNKDRIIYENIVIPDQSTFILKKQIEYVGLYDSTYSIIADWDFWQRAMKLDLKFKQLKRVVSNYRHYAEALTFNPKYVTIRFHEICRLYRTHNEVWFSPFIIKIYYWHYIKRPIRNIDFINKLYKRVTN